MQTQETKQTPRLPLQSVTLNDLSAMPGEKLAALYKQGRAPKSVNVLDGYPRGRMLAVRGLDAAPLFAWLQQLAGAPFFVWDGKSFSKGTGVNRVKLGGRHNLFPFTTAIGPSALDGEPTVILNYDLSDNPGVIRHIHDEVREVAPGVFLGPAMWKTATKPALVLWFALDTNTQSHPVASLS